MHHRYGLAIALLLSGVMPAANAHAAGAEWMTDVEAAKAQAAVGNKHLLVSFTGSDWCDWCVKLDAQVFGKDQFKTAAGEHFKLVQLDFPRDGTDLSKEDRQTNQRWAEQFNVKNFPTVILADADGRPYARTGYRPGGPEKYIAHLNELREAKADADEARTAADLAEGIAKAKFFDQVVGNEALVVDDRADLIDQIIALDRDNKAGLKAKYEKRNRDEDIQARMETIMKQARAGQFQEAIESIDALVAKHKPEGELRFSLDGMKASNLMEKGDHAAALVLLDHMVAHYNPQGEQMQRLLMVKHQVYLKQGEEAKADETLDDAIKVDPKGEYGLRLEDYKLDRAK